MVAPTVRLCIALVLVVGVAGPVAAGQEEAVMASVGISVLETRDVLGASGVVDFRVGAGAGAGVATVSSLKESAAAISQQADMVSAGQNHTCAVTAGSGVKCWGDNSYGRLGDGTTADSSTPVDVVGLASGATAVDTGTEHTCAVTTSGGVKCWGHNDYGQLGNGTTNNSSTPVEVVGLSSGVVAIAAGSGHTCALTTGGGVKCWGSNSNGQLGNGGSGGTTSTPVDVVGLAGGVAAIAAGGSHTCALTMVGGVKCWGYNSYGQLGNGTTSYSEPTPVDVVGLSSGVAGISAGVIHTCAVTTSGGIKCWGDNSRGQLGDGTTTNRSTPVDVVGLSSGMAEISGGELHSCAVTTGGGIKCWGSNSYGQLGTGTSGQPQTTPVNVVGLSSGVAAISAGYEHTCAVTQGGGVKCWGSNFYGQLGNGTGNNRTTPTDVVGLSSSVAFVSAGYFHTCAVTTGGGAKCWGRNDYGQLGIGTSWAYDYRITPMDVVGLSSGVAAITAGSYHTCALTTGGGVKCWGNNSSGQLGNSTTTNSSIPVDVTGLSGGVVAVSAGGSHTCALTVSGGVKCWGNGSNTPVDVGGLSSGVVAIDSGSGHNCALTTGGGVECWGSNTFGQLGDGTTNYSSTPVDVVGLASGVAAISAGSRSSCAVAAGGGAKCWGGNSYGQLGDGTTTDRNTPVDVVGLSSGVVTVSVGGESYGAHTCALTTGGGAKCWGHNYYGQLGDATTTNSPTPVDVVDLSNSMTVISAGGYHTCAVTTGGGAKCWGSNYNGQLGVDTIWSTAIDVLGLEGSVYTTIAKSGSNVVLTWLHMVSAVNHYKVYRSTIAPYFEPGAPDSVKLSPEPPAPPDIATEVTFTDTGALGSPGTSAFYVVVPVNDSGEFYATSNRTGAFTYGVVPGGGILRR